MRYPLTLVAAAFAALIFTGTASAQVYRAPAACAGDAAALCTGVFPGGGRIARCLYRQSDALSPGCHEALSIAAALATCEIDRRRYCRGVWPGGGRIYACLASYSQDLSAPCNAALVANVPGYAGY